MGSALDQLPPELLAQIFSHLGTVRALFYLSLTCKRIHAIVEKDGFRVFVQSHFPSFQIPPYWKDATHAMTTLSRNWDRKAFVARWLQSHGRDRPSWRHTARMRRQSMGFQPVIDSYEEWTGGDWSSRRQVVTWAAGPDLVLRLKLLGGEAEYEKMKDAAERSETKVYMDQHRHLHLWTTFRDRQHRDGRDDITSVNLFRPAQKIKDELETVVVGRANGSLNLVQFSMLDGSGFSTTEFDTGSRPIKDAAINEAPSPLLAACLSARDLALYPVHTDDRTVKACDETSVIPSTEPGKVWSCRFLRHDRLALGLGRSKTPIYVYDVRSDGFSDQPIRKFELSLDDSQGPDLGAGITSVYPIVPISTPTSAKGGDGDVFLSGGHDGTVR